MKTLFSILTVVLSLSLSAVAAVNAAVVQPYTCSKTLGGVDAWPWSVAQPFPWDNIDGYWKLGNDTSSYLKTKVLSSNSRRKILGLYVYGEGLCSKPFARGTGYIDATEKNVVRALVTDGRYQYQLKLGMFNSRDIVGADSCKQNIMAVSMQIVGRAKDADDNHEPLDPGMTETHNMMLKKVTPDSITGCNRQ